MQNNLDNSAWLAGVFEGEGTITFKGVSSVRLQIRMADKDIIYRIQELTGCGTIYRNEGSKPGYKPLYNWSTGTKDEVVKIIIDILPWLGERRGDRARDALERLKYNKGLERPLIHGTYAGWTKEDRLGLNHCDACSEAFRSWHRDYRKRKKENENN